MMAGAARKRFVHWTDGEIDDLYLFLHGLRPGVPAAGG
jgi:hypothetical protein